MLAFFTELINTSGCGVLMVGTEEAQEVLEQEFWQVRRNITSRPFHWKPFSNTQADNLVWTKFLEAFWDHQYITRKAKLTEQIGNQFHYETVGIPDFVVKLFVGVQQRAIEEGTEEITPELVQKVASSLFAPAQPELTAYRLGKPGAQEAVNRVVQDMNRREPTREGGEQRINQPFVLPNSPDAGKAKPHGKKNKKARQTVGLLAAAEQASEGVSVYEALAAEGYIAPKGEFHDS